MMAYNKGTIHIFLVKKKFPGVVVNRRKKTARYT